MKKIKYILLYSVVVIYMLLIQASYAAFAGETTAPELYNKICDIMKIDESNPQKPVKNIDIAIDYTVEILKKWPDSIEAFFSLNTMTKTFVIFDEVAEEKCIDWKNRLIKNQISVIDATAEILVYTSMLRYRTRINRNYTIIEINYISDTYEKIKKENADERYRALALSIECNDRNTRNEFIRKYPKHAVVPYFLMKNINNLLSERYFEKSIKETLKLLTDYNDVRVPGNNGNFKCACYYIIAESYYGLEDFANAHKYLDMIAKTDKEYYMYYDVQNLLNRVKYKEELRNWPKDLKSQPKKK